MTIVYLYLSSGKIYQHLPVKKLLESYSIIDGRLKKERQVIYCNSLAKLHNKYIENDNKIVAFRIITGKNKKSCIENINNFPIITIKE